MTIGVRLLSTVCTCCVKYVSLSIAFESVILVCVWGFCVSVQWKLTECIMCSHSGYVECLFCICDFFKY